MTDHNFIKLVRVAVSKTDADFSFLEFDWKSCRDNGICFGIWSLWLELKHITPEVIQEPSPSRFAITLRAPRRSAKSKVRCQVS